ncbi:MAG TPA: hypothetical protein QF695_03010 [Arenicellales bacterium]|nr:hypothetical protein [Pseudomonadales bacterium]MDP6314817.1 hypothetical protein [Pseudomonadales bacterium]MDP7313781.1 hypothetical protein [Pseudomonadales bacterium]HJL51587.1 hypothetical protein [Arenicellales bacterium]HJP51824.1 hypothetical protein [Pseudomonadales bacterium]
MKDSKLVHRFILLGALCATLCVASMTGLAEDQSWQPPRTPDGFPDLQGVWANNSATPIERPDALEGRESLTEEEVTKLKDRAAKLFNGETDAAFGDSVFNAVLAGDEDHESYDPTTGNYNQFWVTDRDFDNRTSLIVDPPNGKFPELTPGAAERTKARIAYLKEHPADTYEDRINSDRCITYGVPFLFAGYNGYFQIVQSATHVVILQEMIHESRTIPVDGRPHLDPAIEQWTGDSRGHWEGDSLVVETRNFSSKSTLFQSRENLHLLERFTRINPETLEWVITVNDPTTWTKPWTLVVLLSKSKDDLFEYACHEGNYAMEGILAGQRAEEKANANAGGNE